MRVEAKKLILIERLMKVQEEDTLNRLELVLNESELDEALKVKLTTSALKAEEDIKAGQVFSRKEAESYLRSK